MSIGRPENPNLLGRARERVVLDRLVADIRDGNSRSLVLHGEAGIGKTALLDSLVGSALDLTVLRAAGVESEMELAFAGLHQLCAPPLDRLGTVPVPQRDAVEVAFGLSRGPPPDRFLVGLGTLSLFSDAAEDRPLLCVVDDAQWLDKTSALTLAFVGRRLLAERVGIVFAVRESGDDLQHLPMLEVRGLGDADARILLGSALPSRFDVQVRDRIILETHGNPLALLELARELVETQWMGGLGPPGAQPLPARIEQSYIRRLERLGDEARRLLLVAAAEPLGDPVLLWRAASRLEIGLAAADDARAVGLLAIGDRVVFRHPLVRSAVYGSAAAQDRRAAHLALAEATDRAADPDRRVWHLAAAAVGTDERVALELERLAGRAQARGGVAAAAGFLRRSVELTEAPRQRVIRALNAADAAFNAGAFDAALRLVATAERGGLDESQRARVDLLRGQIAFASGLRSDGPPLLLKAARRLEPIDRELASRTYLTAWTAASVAPGEAGGDAMLAEISRAILNLPTREGAPRPLDLLLAGLALLATAGRVAATPTLQRAARVLADLPVEDVLSWGWVAMAASNALWDNDAAYAICERQVQIVRDAGALAQLPLHLSALALAHAFSGELASLALALIHRMGRSVPSGRERRMTP